MLCLFPSLPQTPSSSPVPPSLSFSPTPYFMHRRGTFLEPLLSSDALHILDRGYFSSGSLGTGRALQRGEEGVTGAPAFWKRMGRNSAAQEIASLPGRKRRGGEVLRVTLGQRDPPPLWPLLKASQTHDSPFHSGSRLCRAWPNHHSHPTPKDP